MGSRLSVLHHGLGIVPDLDAHTYNIGQKLRTGVYLPGYMGFIPSSGALIADRLYAVPLWVPRAMTIGDLVIQVTVVDVGLSCVLGIYNDGDNLYPGTLLVDGGEVSVNDVALVAAAVDTAMTKGLYWLALLSEGTPTIKNYETTYPILGFRSTDLGYRETGWIATLNYQSTLPDPFTASGTLARPSPVIAVDVDSLD